MTAVIGGAALAAALIPGCGGDGAGGTATPTAAPSPIVSASPRMPTATPVPPPEPTIYRFLYSEFGTDADTIWSIDPVDPASRVELARVPHKPGWALVPALSADGKRIAYNAMPETAVSPKTDAETYILDLQSGETKLVAEGIDLMSVPRWSPDDGLLFLRRNVERDVTVILVELFKREGEEEERGEEEEPPPVRTVLRQDVSDVLDYVPLGFDAEEATMYFIQIQGGTESGTYLGRYAPATGEAVATATAIVEATATAVAATTAPAISPTPSPSPDITPAPSPSPAPLPGDAFLVLSDQIARDYALSPDASRVAFLVPGLVEGQFVVRTHIADTKRKEVSPLATEGLSGGDHLRPIWHPDGDKVSVGQLPAGLNPGRVAVVPLDGGEVTFLAPPDQGFDVPVSWSPDGKFLAVTSFQGESLGNPGPPRLVFVAAGGQRLPAPEGADFRAIGWVQGE